MFLFVVSVMVFILILWFMCVLGGIMVDLCFGCYNIIVSGFIVYFIGFVIFVVVVFVMGYFYVERGEVCKRIDEFWILVVIIVVLFFIFVGEGVVKVNLFLFGVD